MALVVIGGVAAGLSAAARARRIDPRLRNRRPGKRPGDFLRRLRAALFRRGPRARSATDLIVYTPEYFRKERNIEVRTGARVVSISHPRREVALESGERVRYETPGDRHRRALRHRRHRGRRAAARLHPAHARRRRAHARASCATGSPKRAVVIGAGYIGVEAADALRRNGLRVTVLERSTHALLRDDAEFTAAVPKQLEDARRGTALRRGGSRDRAGPVAGVPCDMVVLAAGFKPNVEIAAEAGVETRPQRRHPHRRAHGDQPARRLRRRRLRRSHPPGDRPAHLHSAGHHRQQDRARGGRQCRRDARALPRHRGHFHRRHFRDGLRHHRASRRSRRAPKASRRWRRASKPTRRPRYFRRHEDHRRTGGRPRHAAG